MTGKKQKADKNYIQPLTMNRLKGRVLHLPPRTSKSREILLIYGQHASIERTYSLAEEFSRYGRVTVPDLPGFGGMEPLYSIDESPDLDTMADYLASLVKLMYSRRRFTVIGISYGFLVVTRMLQKYPELAKKVDAVISLVGFTHHEDFKFSEKNLKRMRLGTRIFSHKVPAWIAQNIFLRGVFIRQTYRLVADKHAKLKDADASERKRRIDFEIVLWKINDIRTYMHTIGGMLRVDLCNKQVDLPVYHVSVDGDQYFDNYLVEQHMRVIYKDYAEFKAKLGAHMPTIVATRKEVAPLVPTGLRKLLSKGV